MGAVTMRITGRANVRRITQATELVNVGAPLRRAPTLDLKTSSMSLLRLIGTCAATVGRKETRSPVLVAHVRGTSNGRLFGCRSRRRVRTVPCRATFLLASVLGKKLARPNNASGTL